MLSSVLEGLARFAHLINVDFFNDLLNVLKQISLDQYNAYLQGNTDSAYRGTKNALHCIIAAFQLLSGQGEALNIDLKDFYTSMYTQILRLPMDSIAWISGSNMIKEAESTPSIHMEAISKSEMELLLFGFELMFYRKKQVPLERVTAFVKRLSTMAMFVSPNAVLACLSMIRSLLIRFPKLDSLFDIEGRMGTGVYKPFLDDPELCDASTTNLWEICTLMV